MELSSGLEGRSKREESKKLACFCVALEVVYLLSSCSCQLCMWCCFLFDFSISSKDPQFFTDLNSVHALCPSFPCPPHLYTKKPTLGVNDGLRSEYVLTEQRVKPRVLSSGPLLGLLRLSENTCDARHCQFALQIS